MRVLVIGGTGFVGRPVVRRLAAMGHEVAVFHRGETVGEGGSEGAVLHLLGDRRNLADYTPDFRAFAPEVVVDIVPLTEADARLVADTVRGVSRRLVAVSSQDVYLAYGRLTGLEPGPPLPVPLAEGAPLRSRLHPYRSQGGSYKNYEKILVERVVMGTPDLDGTVLRLPMVYGPGDRQHRLHRYLRAMDTGSPTIALQADLAGWRWSRGYVDNVALAVAMAAVDDRAAGRIYNVAEPDALSMEEWVRAVGEATGWSGSVVRVPRDELPEDERTSMFTEQDLVADTTAIRGELGYREDIPRVAALRLTVAWERANPPPQGGPA
ncbi:MAG: NAD-dependent epimerase/dehydratase family protein [Bacillota bacterium]|nr:MAG: NAD-dependent epimerase/dehydratase family protein [Bacillota bacterium]